MLWRQCEWDSSFVYTSLTSIFSENSFAPTANPASDDFPVADFLTSDIDTETPMEELAEIAKKCALAETQEKREWREWLEREERKEIWEKQSKWRVNTESMWRMRGQNEWLESEWLDSNWLENEWLENEWLDNEWLENEWLENKWLVKIAKHSQLGQAPRQREQPIYETQHKLPVNNHKQRTKIVHDSTETAPKSKQKLLNSSHSKIPHSPISNRRLRVARTTADSSKRPSIQSRLSVPRGMKRSKWVHSGNNGRKLLRSRSGCWTCRIRHKACPEDGVVCSTCFRLLLMCDTSLERPGYMTNKELAAEKLAVIREACRRTKLVAKMSNLLVP